MDKEIKPGMLLWLKEGEEHKTIVRVRNNLGELIAEKEMIIREPKKEVRVVDIEFREGIDLEPTIIYYEVGVQGKPMGSKPISYFSWHSNSRICFNCKKPLSQTSENICQKCGGIHCDVDGYCLCDHPFWGLRY